MFWPRCLSTRISGLVLLAFGALAVSSTTVAAREQTGGRIAFASNRDGDTEVYVMRPDGSGVMRLTHSPKYDAPCEWSPDGRRLLFYTQRSSGGVWVMNANGSGQRNLTRSAPQSGCGGWSPDGKKIVFDSNRDGSQQIYAANADGSAVTRLTTDSANDHKPVWSSDGRTIAFVSDRNGGKSEIFVMNADGSDQRSLTPGPNDSMPAWSPDVRRVAYVGGTHRAPAIEVMNADGTGVRTLLRDKTYIGGLSWSPDGRKLVFSSGRDQGAGEIYVMNSDGRAGLVAGRQAPRVPADRRERCGSGCETDEIDAVSSDGSGLRRLAYDPPGKGCIKGGGRPAGGICRAVPARTPTAGGSPSSASCSHRRATRATAASA